MPIGKELEHRLNLANYLYHQGFKRKKSERLIRNSSPPCTLFRIECSSLYYKIKHPSTDF